MIISGVILLSFASLSFAGPSALTLSSGYEFGQREITELIEERDSLDNFNYFKFHFRLKEEIKNDANITIAYSRAKRDYETRDRLDSKTDDYKLALDLPILTLTKLGLNLRHKEKHYKNSPASEYNQDAFSFSLKRQLNQKFTLGLSSGINNYDYLVATDSNQLRYYWGINADAQFLEKKLELGGIFRHQTVDQKGGRADRGEQIIAGDISYKFNLNYLKEGGFKIERGRNDTKEIEERDDDLGYSYTKWALKTTHPLYKNLDTAFGYGRSNRNYFDYSADYRSWFIENKTDYDIFKSKISYLGFSLKSEHKEAAFHLDDSLNYLRNSFGMDLDYRRKKTYGISLGFKVTLYDYPANLNRKEKGYLSEIKFIKEFDKPDLKLSAKYSYKFRDFRYQADALQWWVNLGMELVF